MSRSRDAVSLEVLWVSPQTLAPRNGVFPASGWPHVPCEREGEACLVLCVLGRLVCADLWLLLFCCGPVPRGGLHPSRMARQYRALLQKRLACLCCPGTSVLRSHPCRGTRASLPAWAWLPATPLGPRTHPILRGWQMEAFFKLRVGTDSPSLGISSSSSPFCLQQLFLSISPTQTWPRPVWVLSPRF